jgi:hypothetical protein
MILRLSVLLIAAGLFVAGPSLAQTTPQHKTSLAQVPAKKQHTVGGGGGGGGTNNPLPAATKQHTAGGGGGGGGTDNPLPNGAVKQ